MLSDFSRTLSSNGLGTDHGWAGNYFFAGGAVAGGTVLGSYPADLTEAGPVNIGRGRLLPALPWEALWHPIARWVGVADGDLPAVLPNLGNFAVGETLLSMEQVYGPIIGDVSLLG